MIEDDDRFKQKEGFENPKEEKSGIKRYLLLFILWIIWITSIFIIFERKIITAVEDSGIITLLKNNTRREDIFLNEKRQTSAIFYTLSGPKIFSIYSPRTGSDKYHDAMEGLLEGPDKEIFNNLAITYINKKTRLLGLSTSRGIAYVALSKEFNAEDERAIYQIENTLKLFKEIEEVKILVEEKAIN